MKKLLFLTLGLGSSLSLLGTDPGIVALRRARKISVPLVNAALDQFANNLNKLIEIKNIIEQKGQQGRALIQYNYITNRIKELKKAPAKPAPPVRPEPPPIPEGALEPTPTGPPPIPEGALDILPPIQGPPPAAVTPPGVVPPAAVVPTGVTPPTAVVVPPKVVIPTRVGVKPAGFPTAKPPAVTGTDDLMKAIREGTRLKPAKPVEPKTTDERDALLEAIRTGRKLRPITVGKKPERKLSPLEQALAKRRGAIETKEDEEVDENEEWDT